MLIVRWSLIALVAVGSIHCTGAMAPETSSVRSAATDPTGGEGNAVGKTGTGTGVKSGLEGSEGPDESGLGDEQLEGATGTGADSATSTEESTETGSDSNVVPECTPLGEISAETSAITGFTPKSAYAEVADYAGTKIFTVTLSDDKVCDDYFKNVVDRFECHVCTASEKMDEADFSCNPCKAGDTRDRCKNPQISKSLSASWMQTELDAAGFVNSADSTISATNYFLNVGYSESNNLTGALRATSGTIKFSPRPAAVDSESTATIDVDFGGGKTYKATAKLKVWQREPGPAYPTCNTAAGEVVKIILKDD